MLLPTDRSLSMLAEQVEGVVAGILAAHGCAANVLVSLTTNGDAHPAITIAITAPQPTTLRLAAGPPDKPAPSDAGQTVAGDPASTTWSPVSARRRALAASMIDLVLGEDVLGVDDVAA